MIRVLFFLLFALFLDASTLMIDTDTKFSTTINTQITIEDSEKKYSNEDILFNRFENSSSQIKTSYTHSIFWTKSKIKNSSKEPLRMILRNIRSGTDYIDVAIYDEKNQLKKTILLGDKREQSTKELLATKSAFSLTILPNEELTLISKYSSLGSMDLYYEIFTPSYYGYINGIENILLGIFGGIIIALMIYNFNIYLTLKESSFLYYIIQSFFVLWFIFAVNGVFYFLDIGLGLDFLTATTWLAPIFMLLFLMFFIEEFFHLQKTNRFFYRVLSLFKIIALLYFALFSYGYLYNEAIFIDYSVGYLNISFLNCLVIFIIAIWGYLKKIEGAGYIIIGEGIYLLAVMYISFVLKGEVNFSMISHLIIPFGVFFEMIFFSLALHAKIKKMKEELEEGQILWMQEKQYTDYGKIIGNISHQWKQPLSFLSSEIMYLNTLKLLGKEEKIKEEFLKMAPKLNYTIEFMSQTINLFNEFYKNDGVATPIKIKEEIDHILSMYQYKILSYNISCEVQCEKEITLMGQRISFLQIIMTLLDNSIDEFKKGQINKPSILVKVTQNDRCVEICYSDNGGGIKGKVDEIFKPHFSTKNTNSGMGLHILDIILTQKFGGTIKVDNQNNGALFTITIPKGITQ